MHQHVEVLVCGFGIQTDCHGITPFHVHVHPEEICHLRLTDARRASREKHTLFDSLYNRGTMITSRISLLD